VSAREVLEQTLSQGAEVDLKSLLKVVLAMTFAVELLGALFLYFGFAGSMDGPQALYAAVFHSVSGFCNAGFSLWSDSLHRFQDSGLVCVTMSLLILAGGLGFLVLLDLLRRIKDRKRLSLHSRLVLLLSGVLVILGGVFFWIFERAGTLGETSVSRSLLISLFQSVTTRTAGFETVAMSSLAHPTLLLIASGWSRLRNREEVNLLQRSIDLHTVSRAVVVTSFSLVAVGVGTLALIACESAPREQFLDFLFESVSAYATVGLSMGPTDDLTTPGKLVVILLMFIGRIGPLALALLIVPVRSSHIRYPEGDLLIG